ncbi:hypothetical protein MES5069_420069 [Mesorhizobium escarrei]|uniref:Uncharacterized protein n=1 Tax=Mesorhizobium escarrei TaxID=666018 RepID=A0ABM9E5W8_9HYPH|nr:hypothetical protein MES5069_420069 [Mesorhizobium escarrei]
MALSSALAARHAESVNGMMCVPCVRVVGIEIFDTTNNRYQHKQMTLIQLDPSKRIKSGLCSLNM